MPSKYFRANSSGYISKSMVHLSALTGTQNLTSGDIQKYKERIGILVLTLRPDAEPDALASRSLSLLETGGTMIGFATLIQSEQLKRACAEWTGKQKIPNSSGQEQEGVKVEWSVSEPRNDEWVHWRAIKKAPEWAFC